MEYQIVYQSMSGNTQQLAQRISEVLACSIKKVEDAIVKENDCLFVGFWCDKGDCHKTVQTFLESLHNQKVFLFGTAGFGGDDTYFQSILQRVQSHLDESNQVIGTYMCQGKMPVGIKVRYQKMLSEDPENIHLKGMLDNFEKAKTHPNQSDLQKLEDIVINITK